MLIIKRIVLVIVIVLLGGCSLTDSKLESIKLDSYVIVTSSYDNTDKQIKIKNFDTNGKLTKEYKLTSPNAWQTKIMEGKLFIYGSRNSYIIDIENGGAIRINTEYEIEDIVSGNGRIAFITNGGYRKNGKGYNSSVCSLKPATKDNFKESDYSCYENNAFPLNIIIQNDSIVSFQEEFDESEKNLKYFDMNMNFIKKEKVNNENLYIIDYSSDDIVFSAGGKYYCLKNNQFITAENHAENFQFIYKCGDYFLKNNYNNSSTQIVCDQMINGDIISKVLFNSENKKLTVNNVNDNMTISLLETIKEKRTIKFYNLKDSSFSDFYYEIDDDERVIGAYNLEIN